MRRYIGLPVLLFIFLCFSVPNVNAVEISYKQSYGKAQVGFGFEVGTLNPNKTQELLQYFGFEGGKEIFLKVKKPPLALLDSADFQTLSANKFKWYFYFDANSGVESFLTNYFKKTSQEVVVELKEVNPTFMSGLKQKFPSVKIHTGNFNLWPRTEIKSLLGQTSPSYLDAISIFKEKGPYDADLFGDLKGLFDLYFDASMDIGGSSGISLNYPTGTKLAMSSLTVPEPTSLKATAYLSGAVSNLVVSSVATQKNSKKAPFKYLILGDFFQYTPLQKKIFGTIASLLHSQPDIVWPMAIEQNGDPYDNSFFSESNTKPIVGLAANSSIGAYLLLINASSSTTSVKIPSSVTGNVYVSSVSNQGTLASNTFQMAPYETYIITSSPNHIPGATLPTLAPTTAPTVVPTTVPLPTVVVPVPTSAPIFPTLSLAPATSAVPVFSQQNIPVVQNPSAAVPSGVITYFNAAGSLSVINPLNVAVEKISVYLYIEGQSEPLQKLDFPAATTIPLTFTQLIQSSTYYLDVYVKLTDGYVYRQSNKCLHNSLFHSCVIKDAQPYEVVVDITNGSGINTAMKNINVVFEIPVTLYNQLRRLDFILKKNMLQLEYRTALLFNRTSP